MKSTIMISAIASEVAMSPDRTEDDAPRGFVPRSELYSALRRLDAALAERDELQAKLDAITGATR